MENPSIRNHLLLAARDAKSNFPKGGRTLSPRSACSREFNEENEFLQVERAGITKQRITLLRCPVRPARTRTASACVSKSSCCGSCLSPYAQSKISRWRKRSPRKSASSATATDLISVPYRRHAHTMSTAFIFFSPVVDPATSADEDPMFEVSPFKDEAVDYCLYPFPRKSYMMAWEGRVRSSTVRAGASRCVRSRSRYIPQADSLSIRDRAQRWRRSMASSVIWQRRTC